MFEREEKHTTKKLTPRLDFAPKQPLTRDPRQFETCRRVSLSPAKGAGERPLEMVQKGGDNKGEDEERRRKTEKKKRSGRGATKR